MRSSSASSFRFIARATLVLSLVGGGVEAQAESSAEPPASRWEADWSDPRAWGPSLGIGFGVSSRAVDGMTSVQDLNIVGGGTASDRYTEYDERSIAIDGVVIPISARLMAPTFTGLPAKPRLFLDVGYVANLHKEKLAGAVGQEVVDFTTPGAKPFRAEEVVEQGQTWYAGIGANFLLPIELYVTRLGVSLRYYEDTVNIDRRLIISTDTTQPPGYVYSDQVDLKVREIAPGITLDVDLDQRGPVLIGFYLDTHVAIALDNEQKSLTMPGPFPVGSLGAGTASYSYEGSDIRYTGTAGLRLTWVGW